MKKVLFLMLFLLVLGTASVSAQVRIGSDEEPNEAAVLDLNVDDATDDGTKGLALPRVSLTDATIALPGTPTVNGMLVYNTNTSTSNGLRGIGIYYWDDTRWVRVQTMGLRSAVVTCTSCASAALQVSNLVLYSSFPALGYTSESLCWAVPSSNVGSYHMVNSIAGVTIIKQTATSVSPSYTLFCWSPSN